jgi:hypothetical protein
LASCIPNLQSNLVLTNIDSFYLEINAYGCEMGCHEIILAELKQHVGLTHSTIADDKQFNEVVIVLVLAHVL